MGMHLMWNWSITTETLMTSKKQKAVHPGDILLHEFMEPLKLSSYKLAKFLGVSAPTVHEIVRRRRAVTAEMALRLSRYFGTSAQLWQNLQAQYDLEVANQKIGKAVQRHIEPLARSDLRTRSAA
jgi:antitoxin HigA-1